MEDQEKLDMFACCALVGMLASGTLDVDPDHMADVAYTVAKAMMKRSEKEKTD